MLNLLCSLIPFLLAFLLAPSTAAQISPGDLSQAHAELEGNDKCSLCHSTDKGVDPPLCLDCHELLQERLDRGAGLHATPEYTDCRTCHIEHHGREFELVYWGDDDAMPLFNHNKAGYSLAGKHTVLGCRDCHHAELIPQKARFVKAGKDLDRTFLGLSTTCLACHDDTHRGQLSAECETCHSQDAWSPASGFDHDSTSYVLTGSHRDVACEKCHADEEDDAGVFVHYVDVEASSCTSCHNDAHGGRLGSRCESCHTTADWKGSIDEASFDHDRTAYPLRGLHRQVTCVDCHQGHPTRPIVGYERCESCHEDFHFGQLAHRDDGGACESCHRVAGFLPALYGVPEHQDSRYPLEGSHLAVPCPICHQPTTPTATQKATPRFFFTSTECVDCHEDPHEGELEGGCLSCHDLSTWRSIAFDHDLSALPLEGRHRDVVCESCHPRDDAGEMQLVGLGTGCTDCHEDPHGAQLDRDGKPSCLSCHTQMDWLATRFDHNRDSIYVLEGAHARVPCADCHPDEGTAEAPRVRYRPLPTNCVGCHGSGRS